MLVEAERQMALVDIVANDIEAVGFGGPLRIASDHLLIRQRPGAGDLPQGARPRGVSTDIIPSLAAIRTLARIIQCACRTKELGAATYEISICKSSGYPIFAGLKNIKVEAPGALPRRQLQG